MLLAALALSPDAGAAGVAQQVEQPPCKRQVAGSIPAAGTTDINTLIPMLGGAPCAGAGCTAAAGTAGGRERV